MLPPETLQIILDMQKPDTVTVEGRPYVRDNLKAVTQPTPEPVKFATLTSLVDYLEHGPDHDHLAGVDNMVHVVSPTTVAIRTGLEKPWLNRHTYAKAEAMLPDGIAPGTYYPQEEFLIRAQVGFVEDQPLKELLRLAANIDLSEGMSQADDGFSQAVTVKKNNVHLVERLSEAPKFTLRPFRTFLEAEQPASPFLLRVRSGSADRGAIGGAYLALFELDGGKWKLEAMQIVGTWLQTKLATDGWLVLA